LLFLVFIFLTWQPVPLLHHHIAVASSICSMLSSCLSPHHFKFKVSNHGSPLLIHTNRTTIQTISIPLFSASATHLPHKSTPWSFLQSTAQSHHDHHFQKPPHPLPIHHCQKPKPAIQFQIITHRCSSQAQSRNCHSQPQPTTAIMVFINNSHRNHGVPRLTTVSRTANHLHINSITINSSIPVHRTTKHSSPTAFLQSPKINNQIIHRSQNYQAGSSVRFQITYTMELVLLSSTIKAITAPCTSPP
jgi:hypothetical protein